MSTTSKNKILLITVVVLLLTNIAMLFLFLNKGPEKRDPRGGREAMMTEFLQKEIGFSPQQIQQYDSLSKQHREKMKTDIDLKRLFRSHWLHGIATPFQSHPNSARD